MSHHRDDWGFSGGSDSWGRWADWCRTWPQSGGRRRRQQMFESGDMKYVILKLLREKPRHGYEVIKALEEKFGGYYTPSAGTVYPTLQLLEDQQFIRGTDEDGRKVYHITPEGEAFLDARRGEVDEIFERVRETVRDVAGGAIGEVAGAFGRLASVTFTQAWRKNAQDPAVASVVEILREAAEQIERAWEAPPAETPGQSPKT